MHRPVTARTIPPRKAAPRRRTFGREFSNLLIMTDHAGQSYNPQMDLVFLIHRGEQGGYWAESLDHGIFTQGEDLDELRAMIEDATQLYFEAQPDSQPRITWQFVRDNLAA
jgi:predicted RNase H-like HicB family nuclease